MFILLSGELAVKTQDGTQVATLSPVTTVGELGSPHQSGTQGDGRDGGLQRPAADHEDWIRKMLQANPGRAGEGVSQHRRNPGRRDRR